MLGDAVYQHFSRIATVKASDIAPTEPWLTAADVRDDSSMRRDILPFEPQVVMNLAALTDLEQCEREKENAWLTNGLGAENLALIANELDATCIYISTAGIFDGARDSYTDFDSPNPLSEYGRSKLHGERFVAASVRKHFVPRAGWMMGGGPLKDKKFVNKIYKQLCAGTKELVVVDDKRGSPTYTVDFAAGLQLIESGLYGIYNHAGQGVCSRYDVAAEFVKLLGLEKDVRVTKASSSQFAADYFAPRPASEGLVNLKLRARGLGEMRDWRAGLAEYARVFEPLR